MKKKVPMRMCVACREMNPKNTLVRIVSSKEEGISVDYTGKKPGKGAYLCINKKCVEKAKKTNALKRAFDKKIPESVYGELEKIAN